MTPNKIAIIVLIIVIIKVFCTVFQVELSDNTSSYMVNLIPSSVEILNHTNRKIGNKNRKIMRINPINPYQLLNNEEKENEKDLLVFLSDCRCCGIIRPLPSL